MTINDEKLTRCWHCSKQCNEGEWIWLWKPEREDLEGQGLVSVTEGYFITAEELEARDREIWAAAREGDGYGGGAEMEWDYKDLADWREQKRIEADLDERYPRNTNTKEEPRE